MRLLTIDGNGGGPGEPLHVVCIGAHADDLEIGCGGRLRQLVEQDPGSVVRWCVLTSDDKRRREAENAARCLLGDVCSLEVTVSNFRDGYLPADIGRVKEAFEAFRRGSEPDLICTHSRDDRHQDHRTAGDLTWNTWRDHLILEYEIPKYDGDLGVPNFFSPLSPAALEKKIALLLEHFPTQAGKPWFTADLFRALARIRGMECVAPGGFAEAFYCRKAVF